MTTPTPPATPTLADLLATEAQADAIRDGINERLAAAKSPWGITPNGAVSNRKNGVTIDRLDITTLADAMPILFGTPAPAWPAPRRATEEDRQSGRRFLLWSENDWHRSHATWVNPGDWIMDQIPPPPGEEAKS